MSGLAAETAHPMGFRLTSEEVMAAGRVSAASGWTLQECIDYAMSHNVSLQKADVGRTTASINTEEAQAAWLPSVNGSIAQNVTYRPFQQSTGNFVNGGIATSAADKATLSGSYGVNMSWDIWNGRKNKLNLEIARTNESVAELSRRQTENDLKEQIARLYVQIAYTTEAAAVNRELLRQDSVIAARGAEMVEVGQMARADLAQLQSQVSQGRYQVTAAEVEIAEATLQLRQLINLPSDEQFSLASSEQSSEELLQALPSREALVDSALATRPEIRQAQLAVEQSRLSTKLARAAYQPTLSVVGGLGDSHMTGSSESFGRQLKQNFSTQVGLQLSIPLYDNRKTRSSVERAQASEVTARLDLTDQQLSLTKQVESLLLTANNSREKYLAAQDNVKALEESYRLVNEQFDLGLKNIAELLTARSNLLQASQQQLEDKYTALLARQIVLFYAGSGTLQ